MKDDLSALTALLDDMQDSLAQSVGGIGTLEGRPESWGYVGARTSFVLEQLRIARRASPVKAPKFLECGSGFGFVAGLARILGFKVKGIEIVRDYVDLSKRLFSMVPVEEADLLSYDDYGSFDVVYYYGPFADEEVQARFERRIEASLRPGSIILAHRKVTHDWRENGFEELAHDGLLAWAIQKR